MYFDRKTLANDEPYDRTELSLRKYADDATITGNVLLVMSIVLGFIAGAASCGWFDDYFELFLPVFIEYVAIGIAIKILGGLVSIIIRTFADIHKYNRLVADSHLTKVSQTAPSAKTTPTYNPTPAPAPVADKSEWTCKKCGRLNSSRITTCYCGQRKSMNF